MLSAPNIASDNNDIAETTGNQKEAEIVKLFEDKKVNYVEISDACFQTVPCQHKVMIHLKNGQTIDFGLILATDIASKYANYLNLKDLLHVSPYKSDEERFVWVRDIINEQLKEVTSIQIIRQNIDTPNFFSSTEESTIMGLALKMKDNSIRCLRDSESCYPGFIVIFFGAYLDDDSFNAPELKKHINEFIVQQREVVQTRLRSSSEITSSPIYR